MLQPPLAVPRKNPHPIEYEISAWDDYYVETTQTKNKSEQGHKKGGFNRIGTKMAKNAHSRNRTEDLLIFKVFFDLEKFPTSETQYHYAKRAS